LRRRRRHAERLQSLSETYNQELGGFRASGVSPTQMNIKPAEMAAWCKANGHAIDSSGRTAYAKFRFLGN